MPRYSRPPRIYSPRSYQNPFFGRRRKKIRRFSLKTKLLVLSALLVAGALIWVLFFNSYFLVDNIQINSGQNIPAGKIYDIITGQLEKSRLFFFSQNNIFAFSRRQAKNAILKEFYVSDLKIKKKLPRTLMIYFREEQVAAAWAEGDSYYLIDNKMTILSAADPLVLSGGLPVLKNVSKENQIKSEGGLIKKVSIGDKYFSGCLNLFKQFSDISLAVDNVCEVNAPETEIRLNIAGGRPKIRFNIDDDLNKQFTRLTVLLAEKINQEKLAKLEYIDLRFGDKIYYK